MIICTLPVIKQVQKLCSFLVDTHPYKRGNLRHYIKYGMRDDVCLISQTGLEDHWLQWLEEKDNLVNSRTKEESLRLVLAHERTQSLRPLRLQKSLKIHRLHEVCAT